MVAMEIALDRVGEASPSRRSLGMFVLGIDPHRVGDRE